MANQDPEIQIENALGRTEAWFEKNWKAFSTALACALLLVGAVFAYRQFYQLPRAARAGDAMFVAEQLFAAGDFVGALAGDGTNLGFVDVVASYGSTPQGRLAAHYAGVCYLKTGELDKAWEYLAKYKAVKGVPGEIVNAQNAGLKGDVWVQKGDFQKAVGFFKEAVAVSENALTAPLYLKKLGLALEQTGDFAGAVAAYNRVRDDFPTSLEARDIEKFAAAAGQRL